MKHNQPSCINRCNAIEEEITMMLEKVMIDDEDDKDQEFFEYPYAVGGNDDIFSVNEDSARKKDKALSMKIIDHKITDPYVNQLMDGDRYLYPDMKHAYYNQGRGFNKKFHTVANQQSYQQQPFIETNQAIFKDSSNKYNQSNFSQSNQSMQQPFHFTIESKQKTNNIPNFFNISSHFINDTTCSFSQIDSSFNNNLFNNGNKKHNINPVNQSSIPTFLPFRSSIRKSNNKNSYKEETKIKPTRQVAQKLLNNFCINKVNEVTLAELENVLKIIDCIDESLFLKLRENFLTIIKTQNGSRVFQKYLKNTSQEIVHQIFLGIKGKLYELLVDPYANYFCQKFFAFINKEDRINFINEIQPNFLSIAYSKIGTYPLQAIIEQINNDMEKDIMFDSIKGNVLEMCLDSSGAHIIEKIIVCFKEESIAFVYDVVVENFMLIANHNSGLCVTKKLIIHCTREDTIEKIKQVIVNNAIYLIQNPYGNYAIQMVLDHWQDTDVIPIIVQFINKYTNLSMQKYSSNVVEKCLEKHEDLALNKFIEEVSSMSRVADLMKNNYGNYVVQKALRLSSGHMKGKLISTILKNIDKIGDKKLMIKWQGIINGHLAEENSRLMNLTMNNSEMFTKISCKNTFNQLICDPPNRSQLRHNTSSYVHRKGQAMELDNNVERNVYRY